MGGGQGQHSRTRPPTNATRGKFYRPDAKLNLPVYLEEEVQAFVQAIAEKRGTDL